MSQAGFRWVCPRCGRHFKNPNQSHSCVKVSVDDHFGGRPPGRRATFDRLLEALRRFGPLNVDAVKTSISFGARAHFAGVQVQRGALKLEFFLDRALSGGRIERVYPLGPTGLFCHVVKLRDPEEVDDELADWLRRAYGLKSQGI